ncbi:PqiC family protein [Nitrospira sp. M1]
MNPYVSSGVRFIVVLTTLTLFSGCGSTPSTRYYQLQSISNQEVDSQKNQDSARIIIGVGPVEIPSYVDRDQMVIHAGESEVELLEFDRWAEPLEKNLTRVLIANVSQLLSDGGTTVVRWDDALSLDYRVRIEVLQFDFTKTGSVSLGARWILSEKDSQEPLLIKTSRFTSIGIPEDYGSLVSEMNRHVESLSREVVDGFTKALSGMI